jgi:2-methylcitrate dehydratase PrpD
MGCKKYSCDLFSTEGCGITRDKAGGKGTMASGHDVTLDFANYITGIGSAGLSARNSEQLRRLLLDNLGVSLVGATQPWTRSLIEWASRFAGTGQSPVVGTELRVAPSIAALVNGTAAHGYELDDTHDASMSHPGAVVIPAALAVAAETGASHQTTFSAIAAGYEAMTRIGMAAPAEAVLEKGFHPTAVFGGFGSAAAAACLLGFSPGQLAQAWGHVLSLSAGSMQFSDEPGGTDVKRLHAGYAAHSGVLAAEFASRSISAPARSLDGKYGFFALLAADSYREELLLPQPEEGLQMHQVSLKPYSCCRLFHSLIDGLRDVSDSFTRSIHDIDRIFVRGPKVIFEQHMLRRPTSVMAAQYSLPFVVGATLVYGPTRFDAYHASNLEDPSILKVADKVEGSADPEIEAHYPAQMGTSIELTFMDGSKKRAKVMNSRGTVYNPLSNDDIFAKAFALAREAGDRRDLSKTRQAIWTALDGRQLAALVG